MNPVERSIASRDGWVEPKKKKQSAVKLGAKHAARVATTRAVKSSLGNGLTGSIAALIARNFINKNT